MSLEALDRRAFLAGLMLTSAGLLVPKPVYSVVPSDADRLEAMARAGMIIDGERFDLERSVNVRRPPGGTLTIQNCHIAFAPSTHGPQVHVEAGDWIYSNIFDLARFNQSGSVLLHQS